MVVRLVVAACLFVACSANSLESLEGVTLDTPINIDHREHGYAIGYTKGFAMGFKHSSGLADDMEPSSFLELSSVIAPLFDEYSDEPALLDQTIHQPHSHHHHHGHHHAHGSRPEPQEIDLEDDFLSDFTHSEAPHASGTRPAPQRPKARPDVHPKISVAGHKNAAAPKAKIMAQAAIQHKQDAAPQPDSQQPSNSTAPTSPDQEAAIAGETEEDERKKREEQEQRIKELELQLQRTQSKMERYEEQHSAMSTGADVDHQGKTEFVKGYEGGFKVGYEAGWSMATEDLKKRYGFPDNTGNAVQPNNTQPIRNNNATNALSAANNAAAGNAVVAPQPAQGGIAEPAPTDAQPDNQQPTTNFGNALLRGTRGDGNPFKNPFRPDNNNDQGGQNNNNNNNNNNQRFVNPFFSNPEPQTQEQNTAPPPQQQNFQPQFEQYQQQVPQQMQQPVSQFNPMLMGGGQQAQQAPQPQQQMFDLQQMFNPQQQPQMPQQARGGFQQKAMSFLSNIKGMLQEGRNTVSAVRDALNPQQQQQQQNPMMMMQNLMQTEQPQGYAAPNNEPLSGLASLLGNNNNNNNNGDQQNNNMDQSLGLANLAQLLATAKGNPAAPKAVTSTPGADSASLGMQEMQNMIQEGQQPVSL